jgi:hypothetical protein
MSRYAFPKTLTFSEEICDYCLKGGTCTIRSIDHLTGIIACEEHEALARRDVNAWLCDMGYVRQREFLRVHPELARMKFDVPRTDGSITPGGNISGESWQMFVRESNSGIWRVPLLFTCESGEIKTKTVKINQLGLPAEQFTAWTDTLNRFYREDLAAHEAARQWAYEPLQPLQTS